MAHTTTFTVLLFSLLSISTNALLGEGGEAGHLLEQAQQAANKGESMDAVRFATGAIENDSKLAFAYYLRGREHFRLGKIAASVADFDQFVELRPDLESRQWERGLSYYYAGQFEKGAKQFELYQTYHDNDVENSVWRFACLARRGGSEKARETILPIRNDPRVPMMSIYQLFRTKLSPEAVLEAARANRPTPEQLNNHLFYAHFYIGLFFEAEGNAEKAKQHILASQEYKVGHYMWAVARHHASLFQKQD
jgi:lipoprotein NlpI